VSADCGLCEDIDVGLESVLDVFPSDAELHGAGNKTRIAEVLVLYNMRIPPII